MTLELPHGLKIIAAIPEQPVVDKLLTHLRLQARVPPPGMPWVCSYDEQRDERGAQGGGGLFNASLTGQQCAHAVDAAPLLFGHHTGPGHSLESIERGGGDDCVSGADPGRQSEDPCRPADAAKCKAVMRPSAMFNALLAAARG